MTEVGNFAYNADRAYFASRIGLSFRGTPVGEIDMYRKIIYLDDSSCDSECRSTFPAYQIVYSHPETSGKHIAWEILEDPDTGVSSRRAVCKIWRKLSIVCDARFDLVKDHPMKYSFSLSYDIKVEAIGSGSDGGDIIIPLSGGSALGMNPGLCLHEVERRIYEVMAEIERELDQWIPPDYQRR